LNTVLPVQDGEVAQEGEVAAHEGEVAAQEQGYAQTLFNYV